MSHASRAFFVVVLLLCDYGCYRGGLFYQPTREEVAEENKTPQQRFSDRWLGRSEDDVLRQYGKPTDVVELSNGNRLNSYHREIAIADGQGFRSGDIGSSSYSATTIDCDRRFEIARETNLVVRTVIVGSRCDLRR